MRKPDWPEKLNDYLTKQHTFDWASNNCGFFAFGAVEAMTGVDSVAKYRGPKTKKGIVSKMIRIGGKNIEIATTKELGEPLARVYLAKRGDIVSYDFGEGPGLGVCNGGKVAFLTEGEGVKYAPLGDCHLAWRIE